MKNLKYEKAIKLMEEDYKSRHSVSIEKHYNVYKNTETVVGVSSLSRFTADYKQVITYVLNEHLDSDTRAVACLNIGQTKLLFYILWAKAIDHIDSTISDIYLPQDDISRYATILYWYNKEKIKCTGIGVW